MTFIGVAFDDDERLKERVDTVAKGVVTCVNTCKYMAFPVSPTVIEMLRSLVVSTSLLINHNETNSGLLGCQLGEEAALIIVGERRLCVYRTLFQSERFANFFTR